MAAHEICFDFYYRPKPCHTGQNGSAAAAEARLAAIYENLFETICDASYASME